MEVDAGCPASEPRKVVYRGPTEYFAVAIYMDAKTAKRAWNAWLAGLGSPTRQVDRASTGVSRGRMSHLPLSGQFDDQRVRWRTGLHLQMHSKASSLDKHRC